MIEELSEKLIPPRSGRGESENAVSMDERVDKEISRTVKAMLRFYNEIKKQVDVLGDTGKPPSFEKFSTMAKALMEATKQVDLN